eukprot:GSA25T00012752001.1
MAGLFPLTRQLLVAYALTKYYRAAESSLWRRRYLSTLGPEQSALENEREAEVWCAFQENYETGGSRGGLQGWVDPSKGPSLNKLLSA